MSAAHGSKSGRHGETRSLITTARPGASSDFNSRQTRYMVTMAFRVACFVAMIWVPGPWRWLLFGGAVILPGIAVMFANQADQRSNRDTMETTSGSHFSITGSHIAELDDQQADDPGPGPGTDGSDHTDPTSHDSNSGGRSDGSRN